MVFLKEFFENIDIGLDKQKNLRKIVNIFLPIILAYVLGAQKNRLSETVLLSTNNVCFG